MKLFISIDLEGCTGVVTEEQTEPGYPAYEGARRLMRGDLDAVIEGCLAGGADEIVVCDAHDRGANLSADGLPPAVRLVRGSPPPLGMMAGIDESFDAALLVGYHARAGTTAAVLDHTYAYKVFRVRVDDMIEAGELALNAAVAGCFGVPVVFVSGDEAAVAEARELLPGVTGVAVKAGRTRTSARLLAPEATRTLLRDGARLGRTLPARRVHAHRLLRRGRALPRGRARRRPHHPHGEPRVPGHVRHVPRGAAPRGHGEVSGRDRGPILKGRRRVWCTVSPVRM